MVPTTGNDLHGSGLRKQHPARFCPSLPHIQHLPRITTGRCFPLSKSSSFSATVSGTWKDQPTQLSHPVPPEPRGGFNSFSTSTHTCSPTHTPLLLTEPLALTAHLSLTSAGTGGCNITHLALWEHKVVSLSNSNSRKEESPVVPPLLFPKSVLSLPSSTYHGVNKRHIYSVWLGTKVRLKVLAVQQPKAEMSALKHHKYFKAERKHI